MSNIEYIKPKIELLENDVNGFQGEFKYKDIHRLIGKYKYLDIKGGGSKGALIVKFLATMQKLGILDSIEATRGTSVGSIILAFFSIGLSGDEMIDIIKKIPPKDLMDPMPNIFIKIWDVATKGGIFSGKKLVRFIDETISKKSAFHLMQLKSKIKNTRFVIGENESKNSILISEHQSTLLLENGFSNKELKKGLSFKNFSQILNKPSLTFLDLHKVKILEDLFLHYNILQNPRIYRDLEVFASKVGEHKVVMYNYTNTPDIPIAFACRASCSYPIIFHNPYYVEENKKYGKEYTYVLDGALIMNNPTLIRGDKEHSLALVVTEESLRSKYLTRAEIKQIDKMKEKKVRDRSLWGMIKSIDLSITSLMFGYFEKFINFCFASQDFRDFSNINTIYFPSDVHGFDFDLSDEKREKLLVEGYLIGKWQLKRLNERVDWLLNHKKIDSYLNLRQVENLVLSGGPATIAATLGEVEALSLCKQFDWKQVRRISGSSASAILALMLSIGNEINDIEKEVLEDKLFRDKKLFEDNEYRRHIIKKILVDAGVSPDITFQTFFKLYPEKPQPYYLGYNIKTKLIKVFSHETSPHFSLVDAVLIASHRYANNKNGVVAYGKKYFGHSYDDISIASIFSNSDMIHQSLHHNAFTELGQTLHLVSIEEIKIVNPKRFLLVQTIVESMLGALAFGTNEINLEEQHNILFKTLGEVNTRALIKAGYDEARKYLKKSGYEVEEFRLAPHYIYRK